MGVLELLDRLADGLAVSNLRVTDVCFNLELALHAVNQDVEMELAHTADNGLAGFLIQVNGEGRVLFSQTLNSGTQLLLVSLGLWLNSNGDNRIREGHGLQNDRSILCTQGVTGGGVLQTNEGVDVTCHCLVNRVLLVGVHLEQLTDALLLVLGGVQDLLARLHTTGVNADEGQLAEERVSSNLECESGERLILRRLTDHFDVLVAHLVAVNFTDVQRIRQEVNDSVEQRLNTLVLVGGTTVDRVDLRVQDHLADGTLDLVHGQLFATEVLLHELLVGLSDGLNELLTVLVSLVDHVRRNLLDLRRSADLNLARPHEGLHLQQVNNAVEVILSANRQLHNQRLSTEAVNDGANGVVEVSAQLVHLVDEANTRDIVLLSLAPNLLRLRLDTFLTVEDCDGTVEHTQGTLNLNGEVDVARGIDDVDLVVVPETGHSSGGNGDTALLLLLHPVGGSATIVSLADLAVNTRVVQDALSRSRLTSIDVRHDADVADLVEVLLYGKCTFSHLIPHSFQIGLAVRLNYGIAIGRQIRRRSGLLYL